MATSSVALPKPEKPVRKLPVPSNVERITQGALAMELKDRVELRNKLTASVDKELEDLENKLKESRNIANGNN
jgi:hypothetical protein